MAKESIYVDPNLVVDFSRIYSWPQNFRTLKDWRQSSAHQEVSFSTYGLDQLNASASGQFAPHQLDNMRSCFVGEVYIVDLRRESHGFVSGIPVSWYGPQNSLNVGLSPAVVRECESELLDAVRPNDYFLGYQILHKDKGRLETVTSHLYSVLDVSTEQALVSRFGLYYQRFYILDHARPKDHEVDRFLEFVSDLPESAWLHFHCRAGRGRSSTFMIMYDIIRNGRHVSLEDIVARQVAIGSKNILQVATKPGSYWKQSRSEERKWFIQRFYQYVLDSKGWPLVSWSEWVKNQES